MQITHNKIFIIAAAGLTCYYTVKCSFICLIHMEVLIVRGILNVKMAFWKSMFLAPLLLSHLCPSGHTRCSGKLMLCPENLI